MLERHNVESLREQLEDAVFRAECDQADLDLLTMLREVMSGTCHTYILRVRPEGEVWLWDGGTVLRLKDLASAARLILNSLSMWNFEPPTKTPPV